MSDIKFDIIARDKASATFRSVGRSADSTSSKFSSFARRGASATLGILGVAGAATTLAVALKGTYKVGSDYVDSLNKIQALTGSNKKTMDQAAQSLEKNAGLYAKMGQTTGDAAAGVVELTKAGLSLHDSLKAVNATMVLAKAGELSVADASTLVANSLNTFGLKAKAAGKLANVLANAANISSADVSDLAESFKYVSPVAAAAGVSIQQTSAILAELSNSGIKASSAGTALRTFLLNLEAPAAAGAKVLKDLNIQVFDAAGNMKPLPDVIGLLGAALNDLPAKEKAADLKAIFGKVGIAGATAILKGGKKGLEDYTKGVEKAGAASKLAQAKSQGLAGTISTLKAEAISAAQKIYREYSPALNKRIRAFVQQFKDGTGAGGKFRDALDSVRKIAEELWPAMKKTAEWTGNFLGYLASHKTELKIFAGALLAAKGASMAKNSGLFSLGKSVAGTVTGSITGGVQKVFVVNPGFGSGGGGGGILKTGEKIAAGGGTAAVLAEAAPIAAAAIAAGALAYIAIKVQGGPPKKNAEGGNYQQGRPGGMSPSEWRAYNAATNPLAKAGPAIKSVGTALDSMRQQAAKASQSLEEVGPHAQAGSRKAVAAIQALGGHGTALDSLKQRAGQASQQMDMIGPHAQATSSKAVSALRGVATALANYIHDKSLKITADTSQAMANLRVMQYQLDQLHNKTIIVRAIGGHVTDSSQVGGGAGGGGAAGSGGGGAGAGKSAGFNTRSGYNAGRDYMTGIIQGIANKSLAVQNAVSKVADAISRARTKVASLRATKAGFRSTFGLDSIFGQDFSHAGGNVATINGVQVASGDDTTTPGTINDVLAFQKSQRDKARQLEADVKKVTKLGLSKALIRQLRSQGAAGAATLHALASGTRAQIQQVNRLDKQTSGALASAGMRAGNYVRGGSVNADIRSARKTEHVLELLEHHLRDLAHSEKKGETIVVKIGDDAIIKAIHRYEKRTGKKTAGT